MRRPRAQQTIRSAHSRESENPESQSQASRQVALGPRRKSALADLRTSYGQHRVDPILARGDEREWGSARACSWRHAQGCWVHNLSTVIAGLDPAIHEAALRAQ